MSVELAGRVRKRGSIRQRGRSFQVRVFAGNDVVTGRPQYLTETVQIATFRTPAAQERAELEAYTRAEKALTRLQSQVDGRRNARTSATLRTTMDAWLTSHDVEESTRLGYETYLRRYIGPALGEVPLGRITAKTLEDLYAQLRRCRLRCKDQPFIEHRVDDDHECRVVRHRWPPGRPTARTQREHDCATSGCKVTECGQHVCRPLSAQTIRQIHFAISSALSAAVRWEWIPTNPAVAAKKPRQPTPQPKPPTTEEAARIILAAWDQGEAWGTLVWLVMVTGMRRAEALALRWSDIDLTDGKVYIRRNYLRRKRQSIEKDTKTHQMRRISLDPATVEVLNEHDARYETVCRELRVEPTGTAFLFSHEPLFDRPYDPSAVSHRYSKMCADLGIDSHLHALRHYSATELLTAGVDLRTVAGRLGHAGATTLRVYAAWVGESDRRAADILASRLRRPATTPPPDPA